jgi:hypothetical protein
MLFQEKSEGEMENNEISQKLNMNVEERDSK